jgi:predicted sulfurtransferase
VVLDVRNAYEWDAGHFQGAERPVEAEFRETPVESEMAHLEGVPKDAPVMMYCTGGIRCDIYSAALRARGYQNLYTLEGGIANYLRQQGGENLWDGSLFVFDSRNVLPGDLTGNLKCRRPSTR